MSNAWLAKKTWAERRAYYHDAHIRLTAAAKPRRCVICGNPFKCRRKKVRVCGPRCRAFLIGLPGIRLTAEQLKRGAATRLLHPHTGPFETHHQAKYWSLQSPMGDTYQFWNMAYFVREHKSLFKAQDVIMQGYETLAAHQLRRLQPDRNYSINSWKGWKWHYVLSPLTTVRSK